MFSCRFKKYHIKENMDNPGQFLIHVTNRGPAVFSSQKGAVGEFKVMAKQPLKDINKFGLLHYSIPKMCDNIRDETFDFQIQYENGDMIEIPMRMPNLDYYNTLVSQLYDQSGPNNNYTAHRIKDQLAFDEILQSTINWAILDHYDMIHRTSNMTVAAARRRQVTWGELLLNRVSVIVQFNNDGQLAGHRRPQGMQIWGDRTK